MTQRERQLLNWIKENPHFFYTKPKAGTKIR